MTTNNMVKAMSLLDAYHHYVSRVYGKDEAFKVMDVYANLAGWNDYIQRNDGKTDDVPVSIDLLVESILNIKKEEIEPVILSDWQVLAEAD